MKTAALWLYGISFLVSVCLGGIEGLMYAFPFLALFVTCFLALTQAFLAMFRMFSRVSHAVKENREHRNWIL